MPLPNVPSLDEIFNGTSDSQQSNSSESQQQSQRPSLNEIFGDNEDSKDTEIPNLSFIPNETTQSDINEINAPEEQGNVPDNSPQMSLNPMSSEFNVGDIAALSYLNDNPQSQQAYLQKKFPYVIPQGQGKYMVGKTPGTSKLIDTTGSSNGIFGWLASQADVIPSMVGMTIGSAAGIPGAAAGAMAGEGISKDIGQALGSNESPTKVGVDMALSGAFGAAGQWAAQKFGLIANKIIAPKLAQAIDSKLTQIVSKGDDPGKFINFVAKSMHFASGANADDVKTLMKYGVSKSLADKSVNNPSAIINITQDIIKSIQNTKSELGQAVGTAGMKLMNKAGDVKVNTSPIFDYIKQEMQSHPGWGNINNDIITLNKNVANSADSSKFADLLRSLGAQDIRTSYQAPKTSELLRMSQDQAKNLQYDINNPTHQGFIEKTLGIKPGSISEELEKSAVGKQEFSMGGARAFKLPNNGNINVKQAIGTQQIFGQLTDKEKTPLSDDMRRVFTNILYRDSNGNDSPLVNQLSKIASANNIDEWTASKNTYKNFMQSIEGQAGVNKLGLDITSPKSIQDFAIGMNKELGEKPIDKQILDNLENQVGKPIFDNLKKWSAIQSLNNHEPNFLRLGAIAGLLGSAMGDGDLQTHIVRGMEFGAVGGLASPYLKSLPLRAAENIGSQGLLGSLTSNITRQSGVSAISQEGSKVLRNLINNQRNSQ